jgi:PadR family transcriptional regulator, regulatory protein PadR
MAIDKSLLSGSTTMLILKLLDKKDMYGYEMIEELHNQSNETFALKAGTLYPILHGLQREGMVEAYEEGTDSARVRKYYHITKQGKQLLLQKKEEWDIYTKAVNSVLNGGVCFGSN